MSQTTTPLMFPVPLSFEAHSLAQKYRQRQSNPHKAKQVYLNTLAVYAVDFYLRCLGFETDVEQSDSRNPIYLSFMDVADLTVKQLGKLECRPVLPDAQVCQIPPEVWSDRIGYVVVQFNRSLKQATLLGFTQTAAAEISLSQLRSLAEFPEYLSKIRQTVPVTQPAASTNKMTVNLRKWFEGAFEVGWQTIDAVLGTNQKHLVPVRDTTQFKPRIKRAKLIDLGMQLGERAVVLAIALTSESDETIRVTVQVHPSSGETYLPTHLRLIMLSEFGERLQEVQSRSQDNYIQLRRFRGLTGERFRIQVALDDVSVTEDFVL